jgi:MoxR-like ATPase
MEGTYPLPEAQLDRFFFKLQVPFPTREELHTILDRTTTGQSVQVKPILTGAQILELQKLVRTVPVASHVQDFAVRVVLATHPSNDSAPERVKRFVRTGASPRGAQAMLLAAKIQALFGGRFAASIEDVKRVALPALRHRVLLNFEGEAEGVTTDDVLKSLLEKLPETKP